MAMQDKASDSLRDDFLAWQCLIRQKAMRQQAGRPSAGMRPRLIVDDARELMEALTVLMIPASPDDTTPEFQHIVRRTRDPRDRYNRGVQLLSTTYYQNARGFSDRLAAVFTDGSAVAAALLEIGSCVLEFRQFNQGFRLPCRVAALEAGGPAYRHALWHNRMFNPALPDNATILAFAPDWSAAERLPVE
jgi:hypothetical protein